MKRVDDSAAKAIKGVRQIVKLEDAIAVVADHMGAAKKGLEALVVEWDDGPHAKLNTKEIVGELEKATLSPGPVAQNVEMQTARLQFVTQADVNVEADRWLRHQGVDVPAAINLAGPLIASNICTLPGSLFSFARSRPDFFPAFVHFVLDRDAETESDLIAWTRDRPQHVLRYFAYSDCLASDQVENPTTYFAGAGLQLHESPLDWLRCGCRGAIRSNASTARSSGAPRSSASSPTRPPSGVWSAPSCSNRTTNGRSSEHVT